ncbi:hypothetical protein [Nocardiopsis sp. TNDT3]|uniref:hypothetical protein n=1 Tax=Nocardiopsis sp. TNDT3 TaxID=2249354 RepID=UPI00130052A0|nr:hypothetical protein [Nocardiopsis sp. TNDT3]
MGMEAFSQGGIELYGPYWEELSGWEQQYHAIYPVRGPADPDGTNNTYMIMRSDINHPWDIFYNYNHIDYSSMAGLSRIYDVHFMLGSFDPNNTRINKLEARIQYLTGNQYWTRFLMEDVATDMSTTSCSAAGAVEELCLNSLTHSTEETGRLFSHWELEKPGISSSASQETEHTLEGASSRISASAEDSAETINGVNQKELKNCMENSPDSCLQDVAGLADCVENREICNTMSNPVNMDPSTTRSHEISVSEEDIRTRASSRYSVAGSELNISATNKRSFEENYGTTLPTAWESDAPLWLVTTDSTVTINSNLQYEGVRAVYDATTGQLVHACSGSNC